MDGMSVNHKHLRRRKNSKFLPTVVVFSAVFFACTKSDKIEPLKKNPEKDKNFSNAGDSDWVPDFEDTATMMATIPKETLEKYVNIQALLAYNFRFLSFEKQGDIVFNGDNAQIEIDEIPIDQSGTINIEILEDGTAKLVGLKEGVTFKKGKNNQSIDLKKIGNSDDDDNNDDSDEEEEDKATLILTLAIEESNSDEPSDGIDDSSEGGINFNAKVLPITRSYCSDCHAKFGLPVPVNEEYFRARKSSLPTRLSKSASNTMPQRGSQEAQRMSDEDREVLIEYVKSL